ncbi:MAG TPA: hypothetical protein VGO31_00330 [Microbacteriaceae bacterium]|jgi:hypothetical protein|nr:hypothetical protein [Microbacteriaceae bacterium]
MGLLDDAIREHLELKRRRGANPEEVAREQREALDAAAERKVMSAGVADADPLARPPLDPTIDSNDVDVDSLASRDDPRGHSRAERPASRAAAGETAELDMRSVLGETEDAQEESGLPTDANAGESDASARPVPARPAPDEDSLEWEVPGNAPAAEAEAPAEDVLEETPDFLRDAPEQDRLWFEQRPPRDFDFDK